MTPWDDTDPDDGTSSIQIVNSYHQQAAQLIRQCSRDENREKAIAILDNLPHPNNFRTLSKLDIILLDNLSQYKERYFKDDKFELYHRYINSDIAFSQMDMAMVQAAFFASFTAFPDKFGAEHATDLELASFVHVWRVIGYYLGLKDEYNLARLDNIEKTRELLVDVGNQIIIPAFLHLDSVGLHMLNPILGGV